jgi:hypothetical protein
MQKVLKQIEKNPGSKATLLELLSCASFTNIEDIMVESTPLPPSSLSLSSSALLEAMLPRSISAKHRTAQVVHTFNGRRYSLPISKESEGLRRFIELALPLLDIVHNERMLLIDDLGSSFHEELLEYYIDTFLDGEDTSQLLCTTNMLDLMDSELVRDDEVWFADMDSQGSTELNCITNYVDIPKDTSSKKLYKAGKFGSRPMTKRMVFKQED